MFLPVLRGLCNTLAPPPSRVNRYPVSIFVLATAGGGISADPQLASWSNRQVSRLELHLAGPGYPGESVAALLLYTQVQLHHWGGGYPPSCLFCWHNDPKRHLSCMQEHKWNSDVLNFIDFRRNGIHRCCIYIESFVWMFLLHNHWKKFVSERLLILTVNLQDC